MHSTAARYIRLVFLALVAGSVLAVSLFLSLRLRVHPFDPAIGLTINPDGSARQEGKYIATFLRNKDGGGAVVLPLPDANQEEPKSYSLSFTLTEPLARGAVGSTIYSVQGTEGMVVLQPTTTQVRAEFDYVLPGSHTAIELRVPPGYLRLSPLMQLASWVRFVSMSQWLVVSGVPVVLLSVYVALRYPTRRRRVTSPRNLSLPEVTETEVALLTKNRLAAEDLAALLFSLANRGYLEIVVHASGEVLLIGKGDTTKLLPYEQEALRLLVPDQRQANSLSEVVANLEGTLFSAEVSRIYQSAYESFTARGYVDRNPQIVHLQYRGVGALIEILGALQVVISYSLLSQGLRGMVFLGVGLYAIGRLVYRTGYRVSHLTKQGEALQGEIEVVKAYLGSGELIGFNEDRSLILYRYLPYALVLGVAPEWIARFGKTSVLVPTWLTSNDQLFSAEQFVAQVHAVVSVLGHAFTLAKDPNDD